jgi:hypothetical protein
VALVIWEIVTTALKSLALAAALIVGTSSLAMAQAQGSSGPDGQATDGAADNPSAPGSSDTSTRAARHHGTSHQRSMYMSAHGAARSDGYPTLDVAPVCHGITEQSDLEAGLFQTSFDQCIKAEQATREQIIKQWSQFSADERRHCIAEATMGGESSYTELLTCLEMARDVRELHKQPNSLSQQNIPPAPVGHRQPTQ